jgi:hypothetical protein
VVSVFLGALSTVPVAATASCQGHECDAQFSSWGCESADVDPTAACCKQGRMQPTSTGWVWQTTAFTKADWVSFPASGTVHLYTRAWTDAVPDIGGSTIWIASGQGPADPFPDDDPSDAPASYAAPVGGSLGEVTTVHEGSVDIYNATCAPEWVFVQIAFDLPEGGGLTHGPCWNE